MRASVPTIANRAARPTAIRLAEVENAVLDIFEAGRRGPGPAMFVGDIDTALDSRGYPGKWVKRALESLVRKGLLRHAGASYLEPVATRPDGEAGAAASSRSARRKVRPKQRRKTLFGP
jgi:hypothetical protein